METKDRTKFVMIPKWIMLSDLSSGAIRLYGVLMSYANNETLQAFPTRKTLANDMHMKQAKSIDPYIDELREFGALKVEKRLRKDGGHMSSLYTLVFDDPSIEAEGVVPENGLGRGPEGTLTTLTEPTPNSSIAFDHKIEPKPLSPSPSGDGHTLSEQLGINEQVKSYLIDIVLAIYSSGERFWSDDNHWVTLEAAFEEYLDLEAGDAIANRGWDARLEKIMRDNLHVGERYAASVYLGMLNNYVRSH